MTLLNAFLLGLIEGLTEFIPVSSTAHLLIAQKFLGLSSDEKMFSFLVLVQMGTILALIAYFWQDIWRILSAFFLGLLHQKPFETLQARLGWLVLVATLPALIAGYFLKDIVQIMFKDPLLQAGVRLLMSAALLGFVEYYGRHQRTLESAYWMDALMVGLFQVLALFPGASRSGTTIAGGILRGFDRPSAARLAFLMSGPILLAAGAYETLRAIQLPGTHAFLPYLLTGFFTAAIVGWLAIRWLMAYLHKHSLYIFAIYCAIMGMICLVFLLA
jgi:undecaprenyl-diphosphatase